MQISQYDTENTLRPFKMRHFTISWKIWAHCKFDGSNMSQKLWDGAEKKQLEKHFEIN